MLIAVTLAGQGLFADSVCAQPLPEVGQPAVVPRTTVVLRDVNVYADPRLDAVESGLADLSVVEIRRAVEAAFRSDERYYVPDFDSTARLVTELSDDTLENELLVLARSLAANGIDYFRTYSIPSSVDTLTEAVETYRSTHAPYSDPASVAEAWRYLALGYIDLAARGDEESPASAEAAEDALQEMIRLDPGTRMGPNLYPQAVVSAYEAAYLEMILGGGRGFGMEMDEAGWMADQLDVDQLVELYVVVGSEDVTVHLDVYDGSEGAFVIRERFTTEPTTEAVLWELGLRLSDFVACQTLIPVPPEPTISEDGHVYAGLAYTGAVFLNGPTRQRFYNQGIRIHTTVMFTDAVGVWATTNLLFSTIDPNGDLLRRIDTTRFAFGVHVAGRRQRYRVVLGGGVEVARIGSIAATTSYWCKVSEGEPVVFDSERECDESDVVNTPARVQGGLHLYLTNSVLIAGPIWADLNLGSSLYLAPFEDRSVDFPLQADIGFSYRF